MMDNKLQPAQAAQTTDVFEGVKAVASEAITQTITGGITTVNNVLNGADWREELLAWLKPVINNILKGLAPKVIQAIREKVGNIIDKIKTRDRGFNKEEEPEETNVQLAVLQELAALAGQDLTPEQLSQLSEVAKTGLPEAIGVDWLVKLGQDKEVTTKDIKDFTEALRNYATFEAEQKKWLMDNLDEPVRNQYGDLIARYWRHTLPLPNDVCARIFTKIETSGIPADRFLDELTLTLRRMTEASKDLITAQTKKFREMLINTPVEEKEELNRALKAMAAATRRMLIDRGVEEKQAAAETAKAQAAEEKAAVSKPAVEISPVATPKIEEPREETTLSAGETFIDPADVSTELPSESEEGYEEYEEYEEEEEADEEAEASEEERVKSPAQSL